MSYVALYREWRPQKFSDIIGQVHISRTLQNALKTNRIAHAYLFCGPRGTGKTSTAKVLAKTLNCLNGPEIEPCNLCENCKRVTEGTSMDVMEIDAASNRGIDEIRDLREKVKFAPTEGKYRIYIIDEVHMLTTEAFNALLKTLEEPPAHVIFVLATTEPHKVPLTILSRCQRFDFRRIKLNDIISRLRTVVDELGIKTEDETLGLIARIAEGGMRDALSLLDQCISFAGKEVSGEDVNAMLGTVNTGFLFKMTECFIHNDITSGLKLIDELVRQGKDIRLFTRDLTEHFRNLLLVEVCTDIDELLPVSAEVLQTMQKQSSVLGRKKIVSLIEVLTSTEREMKWASHPRLILELAVIRSTDTAAANDFTDLTNRIVRLEGLLRDGQIASTNTSSKPHQRAPATSKPDRLNQSIDTDTIRKCWQEILERIKKVRISTKAFLIEGKPVEVKDGNLVLSFPLEYSFHKENVEQPENKNAIEQAIKEVTGVELKIKCKFADESSKEPSAVSQAGSKGDTLVEEACRLFGGDVIEIKD